MQLTDNVLRCMSPADQERYGHGQFTGQEPLATPKKKAGLPKVEKDLHSQFTSWLQYWELDYCHARMDKPATIKRGLSDFHVWRGPYHCLVEFKIEGGRLSREQEEFQLKQQERGTPTLVTSSYEEACAFVRRHLRVWTGKLPISLQEPPDVRAD